MNQIQTMRVFVCVAELQSFRQAARKLGVSNALVTRSIAMLETHLNTRLIHRTTRNLSLTEAGTRYLDGCRALLEEFDHLEASVAHTIREPVGTLRIAVSGALSPQRLTPLVDGFRRQYPKVRVQLTIADGPIDGLDTSYDAAILAGRRIDDGPALVSHALAPDPFVAIASPAYIEQRGEPHRPDELARHAAITLPLDAHGFAWRFVDAGRFAHLVTLQPSYTINDAWLVRAAVLAGSGIAILPESFVADAISRGELVRLLADYRIDDPDAQLAVVYPNRQFVPARTRSFVEHALYHFGARSNGRYGYVHDTLGEHADVVTTGLQ
ncbi:MULTISPECIES: LysR family transcriptional regulator [Burkholderia]|jgi:DNA-binding transcriptional LysR family regulator|uniref:LysR family transcriptional regulator n=1 Tax=Burkholderia TaxID=32008 RepID=UPI0018DC25CF|nr:MULTISPECIES: LysR family transcriptional regulator [Burkholderia]MBI0326168.1 LysR family transcriptional regulator [Burkholderia plantarii]